MTTDDPSIQAKLAELRQRLARLDGHRAAAVPECQTQRRAYGRTI